MLIGIDASQARKSHKTGIEWYSYHMIKELLRIIPPLHHVRLYAPYDLPQEFLPIPSHWEAKVLRWPFARGWTQVRLAWELHRDMPDIYYTPGYMIPLCFKGRAAVTIHDVAFRLNPSAYRHPRINDLIHRWNAKRADVIFAPSQSTAHALVEAYDIDPTKIHIVPEGVDQTLYHPVEDAVVQKTKARYHLYAPYVIMVGRVEEKKNVIFALQAMKEVRKCDGYADCSLVLAGERGFRHEAITSWVKSHHAQNWVRELGWIPAQDLPVLMSGALCLLALGREEGFGLTVLEGLACGISVVASDIPAHQEVGGEVVTYVGADPAVIAHAITNVNDTLEKRQQRIAHAAHFPWERTARMIYAYINK
ncbi:MAG: glycosyltransferase family 1 protein [Patescibacteria group bacterium]